MYFSSKMKIGAAITMAIVAILMLVSTYFIFMVDLGPLSFEEARTVMTGVYMLVGAVIIGLIVSIFFSEGIRRFKSKAEEFSSNIKYCYACGTLLDKASKAETCPKCNAKLKLLDIIDN
ncbi:MAG: hypothetical protein ACFFD2_09725 [Promethearchaeota archaeon]